MVTVVIVQIFLYYKIPYYVCIFIARENIEAESIKGFVYRSVQNDEEYILH